MSIDRVQWLWIQVNYLYYGSQPMESSGGMKVKSISDKDEFVQ